MILYDTEIKLIMDFLKDYQSIHLIIALKDQFNYEQLLSVIYKRSAKKLEKICHYWLAITRCKKKVTLKILSDCAFRKKILDVSTSSIRPIIVSKIKMNTFYWKLYSYNNYQVFITDILSLDIIDQLYQMLQEKPIDKWRIALYNLEYREI